MSTITFSLDIDDLISDAAEGEACTLSDAIKAEIVDSATKQLRSQIEKSLVCEVAKEVKEKTDEVVDALLAKVTAEKIESLMMPVKKRDWGTEVDYIPIAEYVGMRYQEYLTQKTLNTDGSIPRYDNDRKLSITEYLINGYLSKTIGVRVEETIKTAVANAQNAVVGTLKEALQKQLSQSMIDKLDVDAIMRQLNDAVSNSTGPK